MGVVAAALACGIATADAQRLACRLEAVGSGVVASVADGRTFVLADGRVVRLAGVEVPGPPNAAAVVTVEAEPDAAAGPLPDLAAAAKAALERLTLDKSVVLKGTGAAADRHGRVPAHVFLGEAGLERSVQHDMVNGGLARVAARIGDRACAAELLAAERPAREGKLGLWADPRYLPRRAEEPATVLAERGRFALVEGRVLSVRESGGTIYVNFGRRWSEDFTVTIAKRNERMFAAAGLEPKRLERQRVRVRGFVEQRGGPWIDASRPEQIEVLGRD
jgi:endonuclease YncB( thermonuclease family)